MVPQQFISLYRQHIEAQDAATRAVLESHNLDGLLIAAGDVLHPFRDDTDYPFKVNPYFKAWVPLLDHPGCFVWLAVDADKPVLYFHQPQDIWHQVHCLDDEAITSAFEVRIVADRSELERMLRQRLDDGQRLAFIGTETPLEGLGINPQPLLHSLDFRRAYKSDYEIACLRLASEKALLGHQAAERCFRDGGSEFAIHLEYLRASGQEEAGLPYGNIIALNQHAAILHYTQKCRRPPQPSRSFLIDAGADVAGYAADISRTYAAEQDDFAELVAAMDQLQQQVVGRIEPGMAYLDLHCWSHKQLAQLLSQFDLISCPPEQALEQQLTQKFFPHGLGHLLGLQVHDQGGWMQDDSGSQRMPPEEHPYLRLTRPVEKGMVFTIEPGLYFIPSLLMPLRNQALGKNINWLRVEQLMPYGGIRIEDNIYVGGNGVQNLTREVVLGN